MIISYNPTSDLLDTREEERFQREYVAPFGRGRKTVKLSNGTIIIAADIAGMLTLTGRFLDIAFGKLESLDLEPVEEWTYAGGWYGDLEPGSPTLSVERDGPPMYSPDGFRYEPPEFHDEYRPPMEKESSIETAASEISTSSCRVRLRGTAAMLLSLAKHAVYLSQAPEGSRICYDRGQGLREGSMLLALEKTVFVEDVPWAKVPSKKGTETQASFPRKTNLS